VKWSAGLPFPSPDGRQAGGRVHLVHAQAGPAAEAALMQESIVSLGSVGLVPHE
jgi:hypothetical protein